MKDILISDVVCATNGKVSTGSSNTDDYISNITTSSKEASEGGLFIAIRGGHNYVQEAIDNGATCCLIDREVNVKAENVTFITVENTVEAMIELATFYRALYNIPAIAITGSNGKTSTKDIVASVLSEKFNVLKTEGNYNNEIGVPMTIFNLRSHHEILVIEMGMNHAGEIEKLVDIVKPDVAIITNIGVAHIEHLGSKEGILKAKLEITKGLRKNGLLVLNDSDEMLNKISRSDFPDVNIVTYSESAKADYLIENIESKGINGTVFDVVRGNEKDMNYEVPIGGIFMVYNALCAIICGEHFDLEHNEIYKGLKNAKLTKGRLEKFNLKCGATVINDAYNASPDSMRGAFNLLVESKLNEHNTTLILGDMFELGEESAKMHRALGDYLGEQCFYDVIFCGNLMKNAYDGLDKRFCIHLKSIDEIIPELERRGINEKSNLFFKASNGMNFKKVVEELREKF